MKCSDCGSITVYPRPSDSDLEKYYSNYAEIDNFFLDNKEWRDRSVFQIIMDICNKLGNGKVLDIGCSDGQLLYLLPSSFQKFGLDVSEKACSLARKKGISVLCSTLESATFLENFDMIIALDFLEHVDNPGKAIRTISKILTPGGYIIFETGNADSFAAKLLKEDWSYTAVYGHLFVLSARILPKLANEAKIQQVLLNKGWHATPSPLIGIRRNVLSMSFHAFRLIYKMVRPLAKRVEYLRRLYKHAPPGAPHPDHMIFVGKKEL
jgi:2-polyprenyl-3-methyl-5-hydroxy-6-metoxy-1,4-benzoquinol methylase